MTNCTPLGSPGTQRLTYNNTARGPYYRVSFRVPQYVSWCG